MTVINTNIAETINIDTNGTYDVARYTTANVNTPAAPAYYIEKTLDSNGVLGTSSNLINLTGVKTLGQNALSYAYVFGANISVVNFGSLEKIGNSSFSNTFANCRNIISCDLSSVVNIGASGCEYMFTNDSGLVNIKLSSFKVGFNQSLRYMFSYCTALTEIKFPALKTAGSTTFNNMLQGVTGCTVHFPSNMSSSAFNCGGTNTTVLYDLPATNLLTGVNTTVYERNPKYDTGTALAWRVQDVGDTIDWTPFYTSGLTDPTVGTTIYSDAECTTAVTTVDSIAQ